MQGQKKSELVLYVSLWAILFAAATLSVYVDSLSPTKEELAKGVAGFDWMSLMSSWRLLAMFCVAFFIHNFFVAPLLVYHNRRWQYGGCALLLMAVFVVILLQRMPHQPRGDEPRRDEPMTEMQRDMMPGHGPNPCQRHGEAPMPPLDIRSDKVGDSHNPMKAKPFGGPTTVAFNIMLLLMGLNVGTKYYFKSLDDRKRMKDLERDNLNQQLQYLKYQINPHFFMNTLNNIHALVDIDPEEAKQTIEVLSKLMRYVLYDADKPMASLQKEIDFMGHYINLMRIRYTDKVRITTSMPTEVADVQVPSLLFTTFIENAFKHGVSYQRDSFIEVGMSVDEANREIEFLCVNSRIPNMEETASTKSATTTNSRQGGVGLQNAIKRLQLIYGNDYELKIDARAAEYRLLLRLPFKKDR